MALLMHRCWRLATVLALAAAWVLSAPAAGAHEYWIEPHRPLGAAQERIVADARVGQFFRGDALPYLPDAVARLGIADARGERTLQPLIGDLPMFDAAVRTPGVQILFLETRPETLTWETRQKFLAFLEEKRLDGILAEHRRRGLPEAGFREHYVRHAKALMLRGAAAGRGDRALGLALELVALGNPMRLARREEMLSIRLLWRGKPLPDTDVQVFASDRPVEARAAVQPLHLRSDAQGVVQVAVKAGWHYLVNAVIMRPLAADSGAVWISHWASLTFTAALADPAADRK